MCLEPPEDRSWGAEVSHADDSVKQGGSCLRAMEERQIILDILRHLGFEMLEELWGFTKLCDTIDLHVP